MTIQQLAGSSNGKGSSGITALLGADEGSTGQTRSAGFSAALRNSMAETDASGQANGAAQQSIEEDVANAVLPEADAHAESAADSSDDPPDTSAAQPDLQPVPIVTLMPKPEPQAAAASAPSAEALPQTGAGADSPDRVPRETDITLTEASTTATASAETPRLSRLSSTIDALSAANEPDGASAFNRGLPYLIGMLREATTLPGTTDGTGDETGSTADPTAGLRRGTAMNGFGWSLHGTAQGSTQTTPQLHGAAARLGQRAGAHEQLPGQRAAADTLLALVPGIPMEDAAFELSGPKAGPELTTSAAPQTQSLPALQGQPGTARDARPFAGETTTATPQFYSANTPGSAAWVQDIGTRIEWLQDMKLSKAELYLHPEELGALEISIVSDNDTTSVAFITQTAAAREIIESTLPRLKELLANQGLQLDQSHVSQQSAEDHKRGAAQGEARNRMTDTAEPLAESATVRRGSGVLPSGQIDHYV